MPKRKDWRNTAENRQGVQNHEVPFNNHRYYDNQGYDQYNDIFTHPQEHFSNPYLGYEDARPQLTPSAYRATYDYEPEPKFYDKNPIEKKRKCRDVICLGFFLSSIVLMVGVIWYALTQGDFHRLVNGVDSSCDICGLENNIIYGIPNSGKDLREANILQIQSNHKNLFINDIDNEFILEPKTVANGPKECVTNCPKQYKIVLNRCVPSSLSTNTSELKYPSKRARIDAFKVEDVAQTIENVGNFFNEVAADIENCWRDIIWMCLIALGVALLVTILLRVFAGIIIWILIMVVSLSAIGGSIALWCLWLTKKEKHCGWTQAQLTGLFAAAITVSILTVIVLLVLLFMRKRIALVIRLFNEAGRAVHAMPLIVFQPIFTFLALGIALASWTVVAVMIESSGTPVVQKESNATSIECQYKKDWITMFSRWWNLFMITWMTQFILGCQHLIIAGAVSIWFFTRDKRKLGFPIALSYKRLFRYHLGSIAYGSLIVAIVKMIRYILTSIQKRLSDTNVICKGILCCCKCCIWCLEKFLIFLNRNAYIEIAIHGYGFCKSARKAFNVIVNNALRLAAINSVGDFVLFLAKITIVAFSVFIGFELIKHKEGIKHVWVLLLIGGIFAYFVAHCFISVYEMAIDTVFICFCEDCEMNDGVTKPYFMSKRLMEFVKSNEKASNGEKGKTALTK